MGERKLLSRPSRGREQPDQTGISFAVLCLPFLTDLGYNRAAVLVPAHKHPVRSGGKLQIQSPDTKDLEQRISRTEALHLQMPACAWTCSRMAEK